MKWAKFVKDKMRLGCIADRYLLRELVIPFLAGLAIFVLLMLIDIVRKGSSLLLGRGLPLSVVLTWLAYRIPNVSQYALPVATLLGVSLAVIRVTRDHELTALRSGGASLGRIFLPLIGAGLAISLISFLVSEKVTPWASSRSRAILQESILGLPSGVVPIKHHVPFREANTFFHVNSIDVENDVLHFVLIYHFEDGSPTEALLAERAERQGGQWKLRKGVRSVFDPDTGQLVTTELFDEYPIRLHQDIDKLWAEEQEPQELFQTLTAREIHQRVALLREAGAVDEARDLQYWFYSKFSLPLACFVCALLAAPLSFRYAHTGPFTGIVLSIFIVFLYNGTMNWSKVFALEGNLPPLVAAFSHNLIFGLVGLVLLLKR